MYSREIYNALDLLGDVGGLFDGLRIIGAGFVGVLSSGGLQLKLVGQLFFRMTNTLPHKTLDKANADNLSHS